MSYCHAVSADDSFKFNCLLNSYSLIKGQFNMTKYGSFVVTLQPNVCTCMHTYYICDTYNA